MGNFSFHKLLGIFITAAIVQDLNALNSQTRPPRREVVESEDLRLGPPVVSKPPATPNIPTPPSTTPTPPPVVAPSRPVSPPPVIRAIPEDSERIPPPPVPGNGGQKQPTHGKPAPEYSDRILPPSVPGGGVEAPAAREGLSPGQRVQRDEAVVKLAQRVADLFVCLPGHKDADYSTQSWHIVDTFMAWNNAAAESVFGSEGSSSDMKQIFEAAALERLKMRDPSLANDPSVVSYFKSAAQSADGIFKSASASREKVDSISKGGALLKSNSKIGGKNIFQYLKTAHNTNYDKLKTITCAQLGKSFFSTPKFGVPSTEASKTRKISEQPSSVREAIAAQTAQANRDAQISAQYPYSKDNTTQLPTVKFEDRNKAGYYSAGTLSGRSHIIGNVLKAADRLKRESISMGVTSGYKNNDKGKLATFTIVDSKGTPSTCGFESNTCYDAAKTLRMVPALIEADPENVHRIEVSDEPLRKEIEKYLVKYQGYGKLRANLTVRSNRESNTLVNFEWKK